MSKRASSVCQWTAAFLAAVGLLILLSEKVLALDLSYGGRLSSPSGEPVAGPVDIMFRFYREASGGSVLVSVPVANMPLVDGIFQTSIPLSAVEAERLFEDGNQTVYVEVESQGRIYPRQKFSYVPLALRVPVDGSKIVYDADGRLTFGPGASTGTGNLNGISGIGGVERLANGSYGTFGLSSSGKSLLGAADPGAQRSLLGLGSMATRNGVALSDLPSCAEDSVLRFSASSWSCAALGPSILDSTIDASEFAALNGVTSSIQAQLNSKLSASGGAVTGSITLSQGSELRLATSNAGVSAGFKAPSNMATSTIYTLPSGFATSGQVLTSSSTGVLSWTNIPVTTVNGQTGNVLIDADNINETSARKYYSHSLARQALSSTGLLSYNSTTGVLSLSDTLLTKSGGTMTGSLDFGGTLNVTNLADPTAAGDAAKKGYVDSKLGGQPLVVGTPSPGQVVKWDGSKFALASDELGQAGGGIASLNTLTTGSQSLAVDIPGVSAGTRPSWIAESATSTHRLTIPMASTSGVTAGLISKTEYDVFSGKQDTITPSSTIALGAVATNLQNALDLRPYGTSAAQTGELRFRELAASGTNYLGLKSPDNLVTNTVWTLPSGDGASGYVLSTDGSGTLSWISATTGSVTSIATGSGLAGGPITGTGTISLANVGTAGTYTKVTTNAQGQVVSGASLADTDIPNLPATKITSGTLAVEQGGTGTSTAQPFFVLAGPGVGPTAGAPSFRALLAADIPSLDASKITSGTLSNSLINWAAAPVTTVAGRSGAVTLVNTDISGLGSLATVNAVSGGSGGTITDDSITNADISTGAAIADTKLATIATAGKVANSATTATSAGTANAIVARDASGNFTAGTITATLNGNATNVTGTVALTNGGTGATTAASARTNLGAAASGANSDITSLTGLTTALSVAQGGTGATTAASARTNLGAAASGANGDITSLTNLTSLTTTGNVGIGSGTPGFRLDVATSGAGMQTVERLQNTVTAANNSGVQTLYSANRTANGLTDVAAVGGLITDISASAYKGALVFSTANNTAPVERMRIDSNGNVGIGTTTPAERLDVNGTVRATGFNLDGNGSLIKAPGLSTGSGILLRSARHSNWRENSDGSGSLNFFDLQHDYGSNTLAVEFGDNPIVTYKSDGNVGIGTSMPGDKLDINGNIFINQSSGDPGIWIKKGDAGVTSSPFGILNTSVGAHNRLSIGINSTNSITGMSEKFVILNSGNVGIGTTTPNYRLHVVGSAGLSTGTAWTNASDIRLKDIDGDYEYGLDEIKRLHTVRFHYKKDNPLELPSDHVMTGFIAQEVQEVIPDAVKLGAKGYLELNVDPIHWATVNAVKELADENAELKQRVDKAEERADRAEAETAEIKRAICAKIPGLSFCGR